MPQTTIRIKIKPNGDFEEEVLGVSGHQCQAITAPIEEAAGVVTAKSYNSGFYITDSNPTEANIQNLEDEDWRGCCTSWECAI